MRIGIDIDDTITDTYNYVIKKICKYYNLKKEQIDYMNYDQLQLNYPKIFNKEIYNEVINSVKIKFNVKQVLKKLNINNEIYFITARNNEECDFPYNTTVKYLLKNHIPFDNLEVGVIDKGTYCLNNNIDLFIDDSIRNCNQVNNVGIETIIFDTPYNKNSNFPRIYNWNEIEKFLERKKYGKNNN